MYDSIRVLLYCPYLDLLSCQLCSLHTQGGAQHLCQRYAVCELSNAKSGSASLDVKRVNQVIEEVLTFGMQQAVQIMNKGSCELFSVAHVCEYSYLCLQLGLEPKQAVAA